MSVAENERSNRVKGFGRLRTHPDPSQWGDWSELDARAWPRRVERHYELVPTVCFNCEAACGLLAYIDKESGEIRKLEGQPLHPASRGRNCAKGPATVGQVTNPDRVLYPLRRVGERGSGKWERVDWDVALEDIAARVRKAIQEDRRSEVVYHVGRPGEDEYTERVLKTWGVDGHTSHTNVCSSGGRTGYAFWMGMDRPAPDYAEADFMLLLSSHLESGHYFNPSAQRIIEAQQRGAKVAVIDTRLSNTASKADYWLSPWPGTESGILLAIANGLIQGGHYNREFLEKWTNWQEFMRDTGYLESLLQKGFLREMPKDASFASFEAVLRDLYKDYTPEWAAEETGVSAEVIPTLVREIARAGRRFSSNIWRSAAAGHLGGWMITRNLMFLNVLMGAVGVSGSTIPASWLKFIPAQHTTPDPIRYWNENHYPPEYPLANFELSFLLPHILKHRERRIDVYFSRVINPVWTFPDGFTWMEVLKDPARIGLHVALTPTWNETAQWADYVLPMGLGPERHDLHSYETHAAQWIGFRQPVRRVAAERSGKPVRDTRDVNPGEVWEENEFWIDLSWRIDPDGSMGIRRHHESPYRPGEKITVTEYYRWIFENAVPGLPAAAEKEGLTPLEYMQRYGVFEITRDVYAYHERPVDEDLLAHASTVSEEESGLSGGERRAGVFVDPELHRTHHRHHLPHAHRGEGELVRKAIHRMNHRPYPGPFKNESGNIRVGVMVDGKAVHGFPTPSGKLEFFSTTLRDWGWPEYAIPIYPRNAAERAEMRHIVSQVHPRTIRFSESEMVLLPTFRLPTLIHSRTNGAKWLYEISHANPVWLHPVDASRLKVKTGDLVKLETEIGSIVDRVWVTEGIRPGVVACSHHLGRWRLHENSGSDRWNSSLVRIDESGPGQYAMDILHGPQPFDSSDPDSSRIWWSDGGVHQNAIFPVQPDPISGMHCWHQRVRVTRAGESDRYGQVRVDTEKSHKVYRRWLELTRPAPGPGGLYRPHWMLRVLKPHVDSYRMDGAPMQTKDRPQHAAPEPSPEPVREP